MSKHSEGSAAFDLSALDAVDEARMTVSVNGKPTNWVWVFAGPGHPKTIEQGDRLARERLKIERDQEQARVNSRKWKAPDEDPEVVSKRNVAIVAERVLGWHLLDKEGNVSDGQVLMNGKPYPFSHENVLAILSDRRKSFLLLQALEFLNDDAAFSNRSATD